MVHLRQQPLLHRIVVDGDEQVGAARVARAVVQHRVVAALADHADFYLKFFEFCLYLKSEGKVELEFRHAAR